MEVKAEIAALRQARASLPHYSPDRYKLNWWAILDATIATLVEGYTLAEVKAKWNNEKHGEERGAGEDALFWLEGHDVPPQSAVWKSVVARNAKSAEKMAV